MKTLNPNDFGKKFLVENCQKIKINELLRACRLRLKRMALGLEMGERGLSVELATSKTRFNGVRFWFVCPLCKKRAGVLFNHPITGKIGCRDCLNLTYAKRLRNKANDALTI